MFHHRRHYLEKKGSAPPPVLGNGWDDLNRAGSITLSAGGLVATCTAPPLTAPPFGDHVRSVNSHSTGKFYVEHTLTTHVGSGTNTGIGLVSSAFVMFSTWIGGAGDAEGIMLYSDGHCYRNNAALTIVPTMATGQVLQMAIDVGAKLYWLNRDGGNWLGNGAVSMATSGDPVAGTNGIPFSAFTPPIYMALEFQGGELGSRWTSNFTGSPVPFVYSPPTGYNISGTW